MEDVFVLSAVRTPIGKYGGGLASVPPGDLAAKVVREAVSRAGVEPAQVGQANYAASKSGLFGLTKSLAKEAIFQLNRAQRPPGDGMGLTVNAVTPGFIATDMLATIPDKMLERIRGQIPVGRLGRPEEIARVVAFLAADESSYITGQIWAVNGGLDM